MSQRPIGRRRLLSVLVVGGLGTALGACSSSPVPTTTAASLAKATEPPSRWTTPDPAATPQPKQPLTYTSAKTELTFQYPGEWAPTRPKDQLLMTDVLALDDVRLGVAEGPWLVVRPSVLETSSSPDLPIYEAKLAAGSTSVKVVSDRVLNEPEMRLYGVDLTVEIARDDATHESRQFILTKGLDRVRVGFDVPKGTMAKHAAGLNLVLSTLKFGSLPALDTQLPWIDVPL